MKYLSRTTILFIIAATMPMIFLFLEFIPNEPLVPDVVSYSLLVISLIALIAAIVETLRGFTKADKEDLEEMADFGP
ncbi:MAG: hypothetical protein ACOCX5_05995 [Chloroflexota bacterium]